jgi:2-keto-3-deoxy-L-arabinonate dehydratase
MTLSGAVPVLPTIFTEDEELDLEGLRRVLDYLIDGGVDGVCLLANYAEQFALDDIERDIVMRTGIEHVAGRVPVIATTTHYSTRIAAARSKAAQDLGADMVMMMPPSFGTSVSVSDARLWLTDSTYPSWFRIRRCPQPGCQPTC